MAVETDETTSDRINDLGCQFLLAKDYPTAREILLSLRVFDPSCMLLRKAIGMAMDTFDRDWISKLQDPPKLTPIRISTKGKSTPKARAKATGGAAADPKANLVATTSNARKTSRAAFLDKGRSSPQMAALSISDHIQVRAPPSTRGATPPLVNLPSTSFQTSSNPYTPNPVAQESGPELNDDESEIGILSPTPTNLYSPPPTPFVPLCLVPNGTQTG
ncbi:hypothetical protein JTE90_013392 [Oedothorax gibbosus]|uniref:Uncharacterized protein n=1 Tax=Oedothorax gibbosus TaxID=931172 RepID=A0AAV6TUR0_9ARAC|nr:hypothetical protein JTE90_013392 [Oedothorax gibbosus]